MEDQQFRRLLRHLGLSWKGHRRVRGGVKKRIAKHMFRLGCRDMNAYLRAINENAVCRAECQRLLTVSISRFFRDRQLWALLKAEVLPNLIALGRKQLRIWSAGCASGEEAYSFQILYDQMKRTLSDVPRCEILATDMNPEYLKRAKTACYAASSLKEIGEEIRGLYFEKNSFGGGFTLKPRYKEHICWKQHHLLDRPPGGKYELIFLRNNLLTYYEITYQKRALENIVPRLSEGGFLIIGSHEKLPEGRFDLCPFDPLKYVFKKGSDED
jgi:chemotaxis protein methyltransferase CheR